MFAVENTRLHDVLLTIEVEGQNAKILPAGEATGFGYKRVEGVVPMGAQLVFAMVEPMNPNEKLQFGVKLGVDRIDVEVRCCELEGVFQNTHIRHGKVVEFSFEVSLPFSSPTRIPNQPHHLLTFPFLLFFPPPPPPQKKSCSITTRRWTTILKSRWRSPEVPCLREAAPCR